MEPSAIQRRLEDIQRVTGKRVVLRGVRVPDPRFRGRIVQRPGYVLLEYRDDTAGFFWHYKIIEELLEYLERGETQGVIYEGDVPHHNVAAPFPCDFRHEQ